MLQASALVLLQVRRLAFSMGSGRLLGGGVAPAIVEFVASELEKTAKSDRESKQAQEEKALFHNPTSGAVACESRRGVACSDA